MTQLKTQAVFDPQPYWPDHPWAVRVFMPEGPVQLFRGASEDEADRLVDRLVEVAPQFRDEIDNDPILGARAVSQHICKDGYRFYLGQEVTYFEPMKMTRPATRN